MRYVYQAVATPTAVASVQQTTEEADDGVEIYVSAAEYDALLAVLSAAGAGVVPDDIAGVFKHRGPFTVICEAA